MSGPLIKYIIMLLALARSSDQIPAPTQDHPILLKGGTIHTVANGILGNADLLFDNGVIMALGNELDFPANTEIIELNGKHVFPGLISAASTLGLQEINAVRATRDYSETGSINPNVRANVSYNPDSELIPITRSNGILLALSVPRSGLVRGTSSLMMLDGWTWEEATLKQTVGLHINWPNMKSPSSDEHEAKDKKKDSRLESIQKIDDLFAKARAYEKLKSSSSKSFKHDQRLEGMLPVLNGAIPLFVHANEVRQIEAAVYWSARQSIKIVIVGGKDSWRIIELLKEKEISVIFTQTLSNPAHRFEDFDQPFKTPLALYEAGVKFCISHSESPFQTPHMRNLPYHAAKSASYGLPRDAALRSITLSTAEILGIDGQAGSLELGKDATLFIADGHILEVRTTVEQAFIQGRKIDMSDRHKMLYDKYKIKYQKKNN